MLKIIWTYKIGPQPGKPVLWVSDKARLNPVPSATGTS